MTHTRYLIVASLIVGGACSNLPSFDDPRDYEPVSDAGRPPRADAARDASSTPAGDAGLPGRDAPGSETDGMCEGFSALCEDRALSQCNSGCELETLCHGTEGVEHCAVILDPDACDSDMTCRWSLGYCRTRNIEACSINQSQTACNNETSWDCTWSPACAGSSESCFQAQTRSACVANLGCTWTPNP